MGIDQRVKFPGDAIPPWAAVRDLLAGRGFPVEMRMIDGELSFPDEAPPEAWRELRVGTPQGMVTVRREANGLAFVTWGNADPAMIQAWNAITWAFAAAGKGRVLTDQGEQSSDDYRRGADLPAVLRPVQSATGQ
jgi:hypothetical protein